MKLDHLGISEFNGKHAIITGNSDRVPIIIDFLGGGNPIADRRGFICWETNNLHPKILVVSTGIGCPSTAIVVEELIELGIEVIIRIGTCGIINCGIQPWELIVATGAYRDEGTSLQYVNLNYPAVPDIRLTSSILDALENIECPTTSGIIHTKDSYYIEKAEKQLIPESNKNYWESLRNSNVLVTEMESSTLFILGSLRKIKTASIVISVAEKHNKMLFDKALISAVNAVKEVIEHN